MGFMREVSAKILTQRLAKDSKRFFNIRGENVKSCLTTTAPNSTYWRQKD